MTQKEIERSVESYYTKKIQQFGAVPQGVDWNGVDSQEIRFSQLLKVFNESPIQPSSTLLDYGCGYGALLSFLKKNGTQLRYSGFDVSEEMIRHAKQVHAGDEARWIANRANLGTYDYTVASGVFNVMNDIEVKEWEQYILKSLDHINMISTKGFSFNILTSYSDEDRKKKYLYYANPGILFDYCKKSYSKSVALLHDYPLYEFTIVVRKDIL